MAENHNLHRLVLLKPSQEIQPKMVPLKKLLIVVLAAVLLVNQGHCSVNANGLGINKDFVHSGMNPVGSVVEEGVWLIF